MSSSDECPDAFTLLEFASGTLDDSNAERVGAHVAGCARCREIVAEYREESATNGVPDEASGGDTPGNVRTVTQAASDDDDSDGLDFLERSSDPKSIGRIAQYEVSRELGRGGMGVVLDGFDPVLHRRVAIKVLAPYLASSKRSRLRFLREARAAAAIRHPNVVTIHAVDPHAGLPYLVMEYVPGRTLRERIRLGPIGLTAMLRIAAQIAAGLAAAHGEGVIHRDVKPGNILLEDGIERVKITDFGLALVALDADQLSSGDRPVGTPAYMSPEQVGGGKVDARSDLFCLGCVIYAMAAGNSPFQGAGTLDIARKVTDLVPAPLHEVNPEIPRFLSDIVARLLEKDPAQRFQTAKEVHDLLLEYLSVANQGGSAELPRMPPPPAPKSVPRPRRRRWLPIALIATGLVIIIGVALWHPWSPNSTAQPPMQGFDRTNEPLTVAKDGSASFKTIRAALDRAGPGSVIQILDAATYSGQLKITSSHRDLTIEAVAGAVIEHSGNNDPVINIEHTANVTVRGLNVKAQSEQHAVSIMGACPGLTLERVRVEVPGDSGKAPIVLWAAARGSAERPIVLRECDVHGGDLGLALVGTPDRPAAHVRVEGCRFDAPGVHVAMHDAITDVALTRNVFLNGKAGVSLAVRDQHVKGLTVANNTFFGIIAWLAVDEGSVDHTDLRFTRNLIVKCRETKIGTHDLAAVAAWCHDNWWLRSEALDETKAQLVAAIKEQVPLISEDPTHADFLRPAPGSMPADAHVGAFAPKSRE